jgi:hypothetical protein
MELKKFKNGDELELYDGTRIKFSRYDEYEKGKCYVYEMFCGNYQAYESKIEVCRICEERFYFHSLGRWGTTWIKKANDKVYWEV